MNSGQSVLQSTESKIGVNFSANPPGFNLNRILTWGLERGSDLFCYKMRKKKIVVSKEGDHM